MAVVKKIMLLICVFSLLCCNVDTMDVPVINACGVDKPIENLSWLRGLADGINQNESDVAPFFFIEMGEYVGETIFILNNCCPICGTVIPVYNCEGEFLSFLNDEIKIADITNSRIIFRREDFSCE